MNKLKKVFSVYALIGFLLFGFAAVTADAQRNGRETRNLLLQLNSRVDDFKYSLRWELNLIPLGDIENDQIRNDLDGLEKGIKNFEKNLQKNRENSNDVSKILFSARNINSFLDRYRFSSKVTNHWADIRGVLENLADNYQVSADWDADDDSPNPSNNRYPNRNSSNNRSGSYNYGLTGTYELDTARSENTSDIVERAVKNNGIRGDTEREDLRGKLEAPEQLAIDIRGSQVILASSKASPISFSADGATKTENTGGRTIRVRATLRGEELTVSSLGGETDYTVTFTSIDGGRSLRVTRRITTDYLRQTIFAESIYNKSDAVARLGIDSGDYSDDSGAYSSSDPNDRPGNSPYPQTRQGRTGDFIVPNGTIITGILENDIYTDVSQNNDRFRLTVQSPNEFRGAVIEGYLSGINRSGKVSGRSQVTFNFERITLRDGKTYDFAGYLQGVVDENGKPVRVDTEGTAKGDSQTKETVKRGGIGAGIGAIIGAIAGGGKGAAIGAIIGGSAGAGSVIVQGKDDLELRKGSMITVQASSPIR